jgi:hypothetical protein
MKAAPEDHACVSLRSLSHQARKRARAGFGIGALMHVYIQSARYHRGSEALPRRTERARMFVSARRSTGTCAHASQVPGVAVSLKRIPGGPFDAGVVSAS